MQNTCDKMLKTYHPDPLAAIVQTYVFINRAGIRLQALPLSSDLLISIEKV